MDLDPELTAMQTIASMLAELDEDARRRVLIWLAAKHGVNLACQVSSRGGKAAAESMTPEQRTERASKAANTRWNKGK
jgi:hypothetical protein